MVVADAIRTLHRAGGGYLDFRRQTSLRRFVSLRLAVGGTVSTTSRETENGGIDTQEAIARSPAAIAGNLATGDGKNGSKCAKTQKNTLFLPGMVKRRKLAANWLAGWVERRIRPAKRLRTIARKIQERNPGRNSGRG